MDIDFTVSVNRPMQY